MVPPGRRRRAGQPGHDRKGTTVMKFVASSCARVRALACLAGTASAHATGAARGAGSADRWGVADDASKFADDGGSWFYGAAARARASRRTAGRSRSIRPTRRRSTSCRSSSAPRRRRRRPAFASCSSLYSLEGLASTTRSRSAPGRRRSRRRSSQWGIHDFIVWNEPNTRLYWSPQKDASGKDVAAPAYEALLAQLLRRDPRDRPGRERDRHGPLAARVDERLERAARLPARRRQGVPGLGPARRRSWTSCRCIRTRTRATRPTGPESATPTPTASASRTSTASSRRSTTRSTAPGSRRRSNGLTFVDRRDRLADRHDEVPAVRQRRERQRVISEQHAGGRTSS